MSDSSFCFQHFHHLVGCGVGCTLLKEDGNGKDGVAHADFRQAIQAAVCAAGGAAFTKQMGIPFLPVGKGVGMMVFCSLLPPAASSHAAMAFGRKDLYDGKAMIKIGLPFCIAYIAAYVLIGYPIMF